MVTMDIEILKLVNLGLHSLIVKSRINKIRQD
nr:MAG TPA: hypothetical protein [Bacteriophage sp.]